GESHGLFGSLAPVAASSPEGNTEQQMVTGFQDVLQLAVQTFQSDLTAGASRDQLRQDLKAVEAALADFVRAEASFLSDLQSDASGAPMDHGHPPDHADRMFGDTLGLDRD
ncbi:MAG TPA: hypothetical protein VKD71_02800, partial [Gemmataceae bacterium]|nr:hypothetical protein [Gemmataceae bacterium]